MNWPMTIFSYVSYLAYWCHTRSRGQFFVAADCIRHGACGSSSVSCGDSRAAQVSGLTAGPVTPAERRRVFVIPARAGELPRNVRTLDGRFDAAGESESPDICW